MRAISDAILVQKLFNTVLVPFENNNDDSYCRYDNKGRYIGNVIRDWLSFNGIEQFNVEEALAFESLGYESSVLCIAWIGTNNKLNTCNFLVEVR